MPLRAQEEEKKPWFEVTGYVKDLVTLNVNNSHTDAIYENLIHNRFDARLYARSHFTFGVGMRNRVFTGSRLDLFNDLGAPLGITYGDILEEQRQGWLDLSASWIDHEKVVAHTVFDRLWGEYVNGPWEVRVGRQRINWGKSMVWNPNDLFNSYSYFDFDYEERPGTDAIRIQYFLDYASRVEFGYAPADTWEETIMAGYYSFNRWDYDFQVLGGKFNEEWVLGAGWAGNLGSFGFKGEVSWFAPWEDSLSSYLAASLYTDYLFSNSLLMYGEVLYNGNDIPINLFDLQNSGISADNLSPFTWSAFIGGNYPFHPLFSAGLGGIVYPEASLVFASPSITWSVFSNLDLLVLAQLFAGDVSTFTGGDTGNNAFGDYTNTYSLRLKWSF